MMGPPRAIDRYVRARAAVHEYHVLATLAEAQFDVFPALCCAAFDAPSAALAFFDGERMWLKAQAGPLQFNRAAPEGALRETFDATHIIQRADDDSGFFFGAPVITPEGITIGAIGVFDERNHEPPAHGFAAIGTIASAVTYALEARKRLIRALPMAAGRRNLYAVERAVPSVAGEYTLEAVLAKIEAGRSLLRGERND